MEHPIDYVIKNANRTLGYLRRNFSTAPSSLKMLLYTTLVRPKLEYACAIWDTTIDKLTSSLELVQNNSARFILCNYNRTASVSAMKNNLSLTSLSSRRKVTRLVLFHKIFHHPTLRNELISQPQYISPRTDHRHKVGLQTCHTKSFFQSFITRSSTEWNHLPDAVISIHDNHLFKAALTNIV